MALLAARAVRTVADIIDLAWKGAVILFFTVLGGLTLRSIFLPTAATERAVAVSNAQGDRLQTEINDLRAQMGVMRRELTQVGRENQELAAWVRALVDQVVGMGGRPVSRPHLYADATDTAVDDVYEALRTAYSRDELEVIAHDAGLGMDGALGMSLPTIALHLYQAAERTGRMEHLAEVVRRTRPHLFGGRQ
jgi:hypothetical protein